MKIGMMNDPAMDPVQEILWAGEHGFEFIDLTVEGPAADAEALNVPALRDALHDTGIGIVGHTAWYLPFGSPVPQVRRGAIEAVRATFEPLAALSCDPGYGACRPRATCVRLRRYGALERRIVRATG